MSDWKGDNNPGHVRRLARWREIEDEFGEPLADVIRGLREIDGGNSWRTVAGALGISLNTLVEWRRVLGLPLEKSNKQYDPSSFPEQKPLDVRVARMGYSSMRDAVIELRLKYQKSVRETAQILGCHPASVCRYTPRELRGTIYVRSQHWWKIHRAQCEAMTRKSVEKRKLQERMAKRSRVAVCSGMEYDIGDGVEVIYERRYER